MFTDSIHTALPGTDYSTGEGPRKSMENGRNDWIGCRDVLDNQMFLLWFKLFRDARHPSRIFSCIIDACILQMVVFVNAAARDAGRQNARKTALRMANYHARRRSWLLPMRIC